MRAVFLKGLTDSTARLGCFSVCYTNRPHQYHSPADVQYTSRVATDIRDLLRSEHDPIWRDYVLQIAWQAFLRCRESRIHDLHELVRIVSLEVDANRT